MRRSEDVLCLRVSYQLIIHLVHTQNFPEMVVFWEILRTFQMGFADLIIFFHNLYYLKKLKCNFLPIKGPQLFEGIYN